MYNQLNNIATILAHSPRFGGGGLNAAATAAFNDHLRSPFANGLVGMGTPKTAPATAPPKINNNQRQQPHLLRSPMHAVTNNLGGISISADVCAYFIGNLAILLGCQFHYFSIFCMKIY
jgi:hypothetical protein